MCNIALYCMESPIITLTTDWSMRDHFAGKVKGRLYSTIPNVRVVDISHDVHEPEKMLSAAFLVKNACFDFPQGTIHLVDVTGTRSEDDVVVVEARGQYFIMVDNGLPSLIFGTDYTRAVTLPQREMSKMGNFMAYDIFCPTAAALAQGVPLEQVGTVRESICPASTYKCSPEDNVLKVYITYIDSYGNAYLDITYDEFEKYRAGRNFEVAVRESRISLRNFNEPISVRSMRSSQVELQLQVAITGNLVITTTLPSSKASGLFGLRERDVIRITFS